MPYVHPKCPVPTLKLHSTCPRHDSARVPKIVAFVHQLNVTTSTALSGACFIKSTYTQDKLTSSEDIMRVVHKGHLHDRVSMCKKAPVAVPKVQAPDLDILVCSTADEEGAV